MKYSGEVPMKRQCWWCQILETLPAHEWLCIDRFRGVYVQLKEFYHLLEDGYEDRRNV